MKVWSGTKAELDRLTMADLSAYGALVVDGLVYVWMWRKVWRPLAEDVLVVWDERVEPRAGAQWGFPGWRANVWTWKRGLLVVTDEKRGLR